MMRVQRDLRRRACGVGVLGGVALLAAGCGSSGSKSSSGGGGTASGGPPQVTMRALEFNPGTIHAKVGQEITWTNKDTAKHNVTYVGGPRFKSSSTIFPEHRFSVRLTQAGTIQYVCTLHPWMKATIVVAS